MKDLKERYLQLITASLLALAGVVLLFVGTLLAPQGEIHETVLVAFGEVATFAGSIIGIDYHYAFKNRNTHDPDPTPTHPPEG